MNCAPVFVNVVHVFPTIGPASGSGWSCLAEPKSLVSSLLAVFCRVHWVPQPRETPSLRVSQALYVGNHWRYLIGARAQWLQHFFSRLLAAHELISTFTTNLSVPIWPLDNGVARCWASLLSLSTQNHPRSPKQLPSQTWHICRSTSIVCELCQVASSDGRPSLPVELNVDDPNFSCGGYSKDV